MSGFDHAVFVDAHHLLPVDARYRGSEGVIERLEVVASQFLLSGAPSHRVIMADCAEDRARAISEEFGHKSGFRIRHVPALERRSLVALLVAEAMEAKALNDDLRLISILAPLSEAKVFVESLHRLGLNLVVMTSEITSARGSIDELLSLPLDPVPLQEDVSSAVAKLTAESSEPITSLVLNRELTFMRAGFRPAQYGFRNMAQLVGYMRGKVIAYDDKTLQIKPLVKAVKPGAQKTLPRAQGSAPGNSELVELIRNQCSALEAQDNPSGLEGLAVALTNALEMAVRDEVVEQVGKTTGLPLTPVVQRTLILAVPSYSRDATGIPLQSVCIRVADLKSWSVGRDESLSSNVRVFLKQEPPEGFVKVVARDALKGAGRFDSGSGSADLTGGAPAMVAQPCGDTP